MKDKNARLKIAPEMLVLERGSEELVLSSSLLRSPIYIARGRQYIMDFLKAAGELGTYGNTVAVYPREEKLLDMMIDRGIIVPQSSQDSGCLRTSVGPRLGAKKSISLYLLLSQSCNMRCVYCLDGQRTYQTDKSLTMDRETAFRSIEKCLEKIADDGRIEIIFFGGEPLLNWPMAKEAITHCESCLKGKHKGKQRHYHVTSNLSFLPDDLIEWAKRFDITFLCDVDGPPEIHNKCRPLKDGSSSYEAIAGNIRQIRAAGLHVDLRATVTTLNQDYLVEIAQQHKLLGGSSCSFVSVNPVDSDEGILPESMLPSPETVMQGMADVFASDIWTQEQVFPFNQYSSRFAPAAPTILGCGAPFGNIAVVDVHGDVYPCIYLVGIKRFHIGNMLDGSYPKTAVLDGMYEDLHADHREDCKVCPWRYICGGGCPLGLLTVQNNPKASSQVKAYCRKMNCDYTKCVLESLLWRRAKDVASNGVLQAAASPLCV